MNNHSYITYKQAKFFKKKGFNDADCQTVYYGDFDAKLKSKKNIQIENRYLKEPQIGEFDYLAPKQSVIVDWLRINHGIWIVVVPKKDSLLFYKIIKCKKNEECQEIAQHHDFGTQEEAYSDAFEYIIKNKIINQIKK